MKRLSSVLFISLILSCCLFAKPDEGMWIPSKISKLNYGVMQKLGCKLSLDEIYSINNSSVKDAIFQLQDNNGGGFCTGEIVSKKGMLFTNHHCGYEAITKLSTTEHNYLDNGFWAKNHDEEISCKELNVSRVVRIEDVTARVLDGVSDETTENDRSKMVAKAISEIEKEASDNPDNYKASVSEMYQGGEYYLFVYEVFGDVRFVGAPPSSIGKYGGDTDNWMWPRHTGDFSIFRVYMSPDGKATKGFDKNNVPYSPLHYLPVSIAGVEEGDFAMIMGYPGQTERYLSSAGMDYKKDFYNPSIVDLFGEQLRVQKQYMDKDINIRLSLADSYASSANAFKMLGGETNTLKTTDAIQQKEKLEKEFNNWVNADENRIKKFGKVTANLSDAYNNVGPTIKELIYISLGLLQASDRSAVAMSFMPLAGLLKDEKKNKERIKEYADGKRLAVDELFKKYYYDMSRDVFEATLKFYVKNIPEENRSSLFSGYIFKNFKAKSDDQSIEKFTKAIYEKSIFTDKARLNKFLDKPSNKAYINDPLIKYINYIYSDIMGVQKDYVLKSGDIDVNERILIEGLREFQSDKTFYPDANSTLRLTYGTVKSYYPRDGVHYKYVTYVDGILEKENPNDDEFIVPKELKEKILSKSYGPYADKTGNVPVCFLSDNDITGGNSGSPIINGKGELIGLAFDGNWEWLCSNLLFSNELQRTINVDSRYVLWVIDEVYGAKNIIEELDIRR